MTSSELLKPKANPPKAESFIWIVQTRTVKAFSN
jgi:hypothetical protein